LNVDFETAEAMMNHVKKGLERRYDLYELEEEKRLWFWKWESEIVAIARRAGVAEALGVPADAGKDPHQKSPQRSRFQPGPSLGQPEAWAMPILAPCSPKLVFAWEAGRAPLSQSVDLAP
jgi:hypothetical protein